MLNVVARKLLTARRVFVAGGPAAILQVVTDKVRGPLGTTNVGNSPTIQVGSETAISKIEDANQMVLDLLRRDAPVSPGKTLSLVVPVYKTQRAWATALIESINSQTDQRFELILVFDGPQDELRSLMEEKMNGAFDRKFVTLPVNVGVSSATNAGLQAASGEFVVVIDHDDFLSPLFVSAFNVASRMAPGTDIFFADEAQTTEDGIVVSIASRGKFDLRHYMSHPYIVHPIFIRRSLIQEVGGLNPDMQVSHDVDYMLRCLRSAETVTSIPMLLYYWRTHSGSLGHDRSHEVMSATRTSLTEFIKSSYPSWSAFEVSDGSHFNTFTIKPPLQDARVAVVIPTKNHGDILKQCLESIREREAHNRTKMDIYIVDHSSTETETLQQLDEWEKDGVAAVLRYSGPWNFSAINNYACRMIAKTGRPYTHFAFMNNDIQLVTNTWLDDIMTKFGFPDVGLVGPCLIYPNNIVQHAGVVIGLTGTAEHSHKFLPFFRDANGDRHIGYLGSLTATRDYQAITAALMVVQADLFHSVGGFDEDLAVGFGDTDLCLRIAETTGHRSCYAGDVVAIHHESISRGVANYDPHPRDSVLFNHRHRVTVEGGDDYYGAFMDWRHPGIGFAVPLHSRARIKSVDMRTYFKEPDA